MRMSDYLYYLAALFTVKDPILLLPLDQVAGRVPQLLWTSQLPLQEIVT